MEVNNNEAIRINNPYTQKLAWNLQQALPDAKVTVAGSYIYLYLVGEEKPDLKKWLYSVLESLPEIDYPIERVNFEIYENDEINLMTLINPSERDVTAEQSAIESGLSFSKPSDASWYVPMALEHPYYSDKTYFKKQPKKGNKPVTFDDVKDLPNVKPILEEMRKDGIDF